MPQAAITQMQYETATISKGGIVSLFFPSKNTT